MVILLHAAYLDPLFAPLTKTGDSVFGLFSIIQLFPPMMGQLTAAYCGNFSPSPASTLTFIAAPAQRLSSVMFYI